MKTDIYQKLVADFGSETPSALRAIEQLDAESKGLISARLLRAIVFLSRGDLLELRRIIDIARQDYRDVLWQAEYDGGERRLRDFERSFHELGLIERNT